MITSTLTHLNTVVHKFIALFKTSNNISETTSEYSECCDNVEEHIAELLGYSSVYEYHRFIKSDDVAGFR